jgi:hypothetical protein
MIMGAVSAAKRRNAAEGGGGPDMSWCRTMPEAAVVVTLSEASGYMVA